MPLRPLYIYQKPRIQLPLWILRPTVPGPPKYPKQGTFTRNNEIMGTLGTWCIMLGTLEVEEVP